MPPNTKKDKQATHNAISTSPSWIYHDFSWTPTDEPHASRRKQILAAHPEIERLFGPERKTFYLVVAMVLAQFFMVYITHQMSWPYIFLFAYFVGATINHSLQLAVHEMAHNLVFHTPEYNQWLAIFANLPTSFPSGCMFRRYHMEHHQYQGVDGVDTDIPTPNEVNLVENVWWRKIIWLILQPGFYAVRPLWTKPKRPNNTEWFNLVCVVVCDLVLLYFFGIKSVAYLLSGTLLGLGLHPTAGHFVAEHYEFVKGLETYSYYGPFNYINFNVGYHNEHHDFPRVAWSRLPLVKKLAPEFYDHLPCHTSYLAVFWRYITDPTMGAFSRVKRRVKEGITPI